MKIVGNYMSHFLGVQGKNQRCVKNSNKTDDNYSRVLIMEDYGK